MKNKIESIMANKDFQDELKKAIDSGKWTDYHFNGEDEYPVEVFDVENANANVMEVLKRWFTNEQEKHN